MMLRSKYLLYLVWCSYSTIHVSSFLSISSSQRRILATSTLQLKYDDFSEFDLTNGKSLTHVNGSSQHTSRFPKLKNIITSSPLSYSDEVSNNIISQLIASGFIDDNDVTNFAKGFIHREEVLSQILIQDFAWDVMDAHRARVGVIELVQQTVGYVRPQLQPPEKNVDVTAASTPTQSAMIGESPYKQTHDQQKVNALELESAPTPKPEVKVASWKSVLVNDKAKQRRTKKQSNGQDSSKNKDTYSYGLATTDRETYPTLFEELDDYWAFMTVPQTSTLAEPPIREKTAEVYRTHARLFLGWMLDARTEESILELADSSDTDRGNATPTSPKKLLKSSSAGVDSKKIHKEMWKRVSERSDSEQTGSRLTNDDREELLKQRVSLVDIFPDASSQSATCVLNYILWLRAHRDISSNYEANILRGLIKLVKFRHALVLSQTDQTEHNAVAKNTTPLDDLPIVKELRRLHRDAGHKAKKSQRSSDEGKKWLEWDEYLGVIELLKSDLMEMIEKYEAVIEASGGKDDKKEDRMKKDIATIYQHYLILSFFACVPDRQRTFRELELGRSFLRVDNAENGGAIWVIKHTADDYKTGSTYGERPPLPISPSLTQFIDDFLERWRPSLITEANPSSSFLFLQPRTGNPLTPNSIYQIVSRCCYKYKQKKTNPHLLRDMIVTHIRKNSDASEKELEALALFMGHSVSMQRESYDRRTLEQKIEPAIQMMQQIMPDTSRGK